VHKGIEMRKYIKTIFVICSLAITVFACGLPGTATPPVNVLPPTLAPLTEPVELKSTPFSEESQVPVYKITAQIPYLDPSTHPSVQAFNAYVKSVVEAEIAAFKGGMAEMPETPISSGSSFDVQYVLIGQKGGAFSLISWVIRMGRRILIRTASRSTMICKTSSH
jgi:hypothetical protein